MYWAEEGCLCILVIKELRKRADDCTYVCFVSRRALLSNELENVEQQLEAKVS